MDDVILLQTMNDLVDHATSAILTTLNAEGWPETRAMLNLRNKNQFKGLIRFMEAKDSVENLTMFFTTNASSTKISHLRADPRVSVYYSTVGEFRGLMLSGTMEIVEDKALMHEIWQPGWELYYHHGMEDPEFSVLRFSCEWAKYYHGQETHTLHLKTQHWVDGY